MKDEARESFIFHVFLWGKIVNMYELYIKMGDFIKWN